ncbi:MAG: hypothetical protein ACLFUR_02335 [Candidatus Hadarchaeia archaeon]
MTGEVICAVPGCNNELTKEQRIEKKAVCSNCEAAKMHICEACGKQIKPKRIRNGATLCEECEMNPSDLEGVGAEMGDYGEEYNPDDYMV